MFRSRIALRRAANSTGSLKTLVRTLIEPACRNGFCRVFSVSFAPKDQRHRANHAQGGALGDDVEGVIQQ